MSSNAGSYLTLSLESPMMFIVKTTVLYFEKKKVGMDNSPAELNASLDKQLAL
jgi:hypothetical protein